MIIHSMCLTHVYKNLTKSSFIENAWKITRKNFSKTSVNYDKHIEITPTEGNISINCVAYTLLFLI